MFAPILPTTGPGNFTASLSVCDIEQGADGRLSVKDTLTLYSINRYVTPLHLPHPPPRTSFSQALPLAELFYLVNFLQSSFLGPYIALLSYYFVATALNFNSDSFYGADYESYQL